MCHFGEGIWIQRYPLILHFVKPLTSYHILPKLSPLRLWKLSLNDFIHRIFEAFCWCETIEAIKAAIIRNHCFLVSCNSFVMEVCMGVYNFPTFVTPLRVLPSVVLKIRQYISLMMIQDKLRSQLLAHQLLWRWYT